MAEVGIVLGGVGERVLVVAPHQDDECIGPGGSLARWAAAGATVGVLWMSATDRGERIGAEALAALEVLGVDWYRGLGIRPYGLAGTQEELRSTVAALRAFAPTTLLLPHADEDDRQHRLTGELGREARWLAAYDIDPELGTPIPELRLVLEYEVWTPLRRPAVYVDISATVDIKRQAIDRYRSQNEIVAFSEAATALNRYRGLMSGVGAFAEAYGVLRATA